MEGYLWTNVYVIDEVTGRIYAEISGDLQRIRVMCSHRKRDEQELALHLRKGRNEDTTVAGSMRGGLAAPSPDRTPERSGGPGPREGAVKVASMRAQVRSEGAPTTAPQSMEQDRVSPVGVIRPITSTTSPLLGSGGNTPPRDREEELVDQMDEVWLTARRNIITRSLLPAARNIRPQRWEDLRYDQARHAQEWVLDLRNARYSLEVTLLNQHLQAVANEGLSGSTLQEARDEVMRIYTQHLQAEIEPFQDYLRVVDPTDTEELEIPDEEEIEFTYQRNTPWTEEEYMKLLLRLRRHWYRSETWDDLFRFVVRSRPRLLESHNYCMSHMISEWKYQQEKGLLWKEWAEQVLSREVHPEGPPDEEDWIPSGGNFRRYVSVTNPPRMPEGVLIPLVESASSATGSFGGGQVSPRERIEVSPLGDDVSREERDAERRRAVQAVRDITTTSGAPAESEEQKYAWDTLCDEPLGLPEELPARVSDPGTPPRENEETTPELLTPKELLPTPASQTEGGTTREGEMHQRDDSRTRSMTRKSRIPTPTPRKMGTIRDKKGEDERGNLGQYGLGSVAQGRHQYPSREITDTTMDGKRRPTSERYRSTPTGPPQHIEPQPQRLYFETPAEDMHNRCIICNEPGHLIENCKGGQRRESEDPRSHHLGEEDPPYKRCRNCDLVHTGTCPCGWCNQLGHVAEQCTARYDSEEMRERFPKRQKQRKVPLAQYQCWKCSQYYSFKEYCPNITYPQLKLGECKACGQTGGQHANGCDYDAIRRRLLLCSFCGKAGHIHQDCQVKQRVRNREQIEGDSRDCLEGTLRDPAESQRDWEHPGIYPQWEPHPDGFEILNRGRPSTQIRTPDLRKDMSTRRVGVDEPTSRWDIVGCSFCGEVGHAYTSCALL